MKKQASPNLPGRGEPDLGLLPEYVPPKIVTYTSEELLEQVGPALTCSPSPCVIPPHQPAKQGLPKY